MPTTGEISIQGFNVANSFEEARKLIGYCPQYDAIFPMLTVEETLKFYALVKGLRTHKIHHAVEKGIRDLNLKDHRHKLAGTLSGGNKRKLSVAMALLGNPPIVLLDEPSAGMDPEARRFMWQVVEKISQRDKKSAVILTTHSMEEAEALSTKLGIMVRGGIFRCMGSSQHIKNKFGVGYEVEIKVKKAQYHELQEMAHALGFEADLQTKVALSGAV
jgi:ATP-binding cassette subfamily A (ABC1) protein 3